MTKRARHAAPPAAQPTEMEFQVLCVLWERGPSTVRDVLAAMPDRKPRAYTTVLSTLQTMQKKGLVAYERRGLAYLYRPVAAKRQVVRPRLREWVRRVFGGSPAAVMQHLLEEGEVTDGELAAMRRLLDQRAARSRGTDKRGA